MMAPHLGAHASDGASRAGEGNVVDLHQAFRARAQPQAVTMTASTKYIASTGLTPELLHCPLTSALPAQVSGLPYYPLGVTIAHAVIIACVRVPNQHGVFPSVTSQVIFECGP